MAIGGKRHKVLMLDPDRRILSRLGEREDLEVVVLYSPSHKSSGRFDPDGPHHRSVWVDARRDPAAVVAALTRAGEALDSFDTIYTTDEFSVVLAALLSAAGGISGPSVDTAVRFRDKSLQKACVGRAGIPTAGFVVMEDIADADPWDYAEFLPGVIKPILGAGTVSTRRVDDVDQLAEFIRTNGPNSPVRTFALETLVDGREWTCDGLVLDGEILFTAMGRYGAPILRSVTGDEQFHMLKFGQQDAPEYHERAAPLVGPALAALGLRSGVFHMELFEDEDGNLLFGECASRLGGALTWEQTYYQFGVDLAMGSLDCQLGIKPDIPDTPPRRGVTASGFLMAPSSGIMVGCPDAEALMGHDGVVAARVEKPWGTRVTASPERLYEARLGQVLVFDETERGARARLSDVLRWFSDQVWLVPDGASEKELRGLALRTGFHFESPPGFRPLWAPVAGRSA